MRGMTADGTFLILRAGEAEGLVTPAEAIASIAAAWRDLGLANQTSSSPPSLSLAEGDTRYELAGARLPAELLAGFRLTAAGPQAAPPWLWLVEPASGQPLALIEGGWLAGLRGAATAALAARLLAPPGLRRAALLGLGEAAALLPAMLAAALPGLETLHVVAEPPEAAEALGARPQPGLTLVPDVATAVAGAGLILLATTADALQAGMLAPGATVIGLDEAEIPPDIRASADHVLADAELGAVAAGLKAGRQGVEDLVLAQLRGAPLEDLALAALAWRKARAAGVGVAVPLWQG